MKRFFSIVLVFILCISLSGCYVLQAAFSDDNESSQAFYERVTESKALIDVVAMDVCTAWKDAEMSSDLSTQKVNDEIEKAKQKHSDKITKINELDTEIRDLFNKAKDETSEYSDIWFSVKNVMARYAEYKDAVLNANAALDFDSSSIPTSKDSLDSALCDLYTEL